MLFVCFFWSNANYSSFSFSQINSFLFFSVHEIFYILFSLMIKQYNWEISWIIKEHSLLYIKYLWKTASTDAFLCSWPPADLAVIPARDAKTERETELQREDVEYFIYCFSPYLPLVFEQTGRSELSSANREWNTDITCHVDLRMPWK